MRIVKIVTKADYAAVAFSSIDKQSRCWDAQWLDKSVDISAVSACKLIIYSAGLSISCLYRSCTCRSCKVPSINVVIDILFPKKTKEEFQPFDAEIVAASTQRGLDAVQAREAWAVLATREGWEKLPRYAVGVSSGATMVTSDSQLLPSNTNEHLPGVKCEAESSVVQIRAAAPRALSKRVKVCMPYPLLCCNRCCSWHSGCSWMVLCLR